MTKVYCADVSCAYCNEKGVCTQKSIGLAWTSVMTVHDGRQEYNKCRMYQKSAAMEKIEGFMKEHPFQPDSRGGVTPSPDR